MVHLICLRISVNAQLNHSESAIYRYRIAYLTHIVYVSSFLPKIFCTFSICVLALIA